MLKCNQCPWALQVQQQIQQQLSLALTSAGGSTVLSQQSRAVLAEVLGIILGDPAAVPQVLLSSISSNSNSDCNLSSSGRNGVDASVGALPPSEEGMYAIPCGMRMGGSKGAVGAALSKGAGLSWVAAGGVGLPIASLGLTSGFMKVQN